MRFKDQQIAELRQVIDKKSKDIITEITVHHGESG
jgi:hypothetical protein